VILKKKEQSWKSEEAGWWLTMEAFWFGDNERDEVARLKKGTCPAKHVFELLPCQDDKITGCCLT
jgi:hypothetical protein